MTNLGKVHPSRLNEDPSVFCETDAIWFLGPAQNCDDSGEKKLRAIGRTIRHVLGECGGEFSNEMIQRAIYVAMHVPRLLPTEVHKADDPLDTVSHASTRGLALLASASPRTAPARRAI